MKKIFKWLFCNLYYYYARGNKGHGEYLNVISVGCMFALPLMALFIFISGLIGGINHNRFLNRFSMVIFGICFFIIWHLVIYHNKLYKRLLDGFSKEDYHAGIIFYTVLLFVVLPYGLLFLWRFALGASHLIG